MKNKPFKIAIDPLNLPQGNNVNGIKGEKCNNCGGFGYTLGLKGETVNCRDCEKTGVKLPTIRELQNQISSLKTDLFTLKTDLFTLKQALLNILETEGIPIPKKVKEAVN